MCTDDTQCLALGIEFYLFRKDLSNRIEEECEGHVDTFRHIECERITPDNYVHLEIRKFTPGGKARDVLELPNNYFTTVYKKTEVGSNGSIYQMITDQDGVRILLWEMQ